MADLYMDVDTAVTVPVNVFPLTDDTDFKTRKTGASAVAYNAAGMDLVWNFVTTAGVITQTAVTPTTSGVYDWSEVGDAMYKIELPASGGASANNDTEGVGWFTGYATGVLPWRGPTVCFRPAAVNNAMVDGTAQYATQTSVDAIDTALDGFTNDPDDVAAVILSTPANMLATDSAGHVSADLTDDALAAVWAYATRTLSSFGTLVADIVAAMQDAGTSLATLLSRLTDLRATKLDRDLAEKGDLQVTVNPTPVTVNPTVLDEAERTAIAEAVAGTDEVVLLVKHIMNQLERTVNEETGIVTVVLRDDDDETALKTWTFDPTTEIRSRAT